MTTPSQIFIKKFIKDLGAELKRVRELKGLSYEEAADLAVIPRPFSVENVEKGKGKLLFKAIRLAIAYKQNLVIKLEDTDND